MRTMEVECVYYFVLRMANKSDIMERQTLHQFLHGDYLHSPSRNFNVDLKQFPDLFPHLHGQLRFEEQYHDIG